MFIERVSIPDKTRIKTEEASAPKRARSHKVLNLPGSDGLENILEWPPVIPGRATDSSGRVYFRHMSTSVRLSHYLTRGISGISLDCLYFFPIWGLVLESKCFKQLNQYYKG